MHSASKEAARPACLAARSKLQLGDSQSVCTLQLTLTRCVSWKLQTPFNSNLHNSGCSLVCPTPQGLSVSSFTCCSMLPAQQLAHSDLLLQDGLFMIAFDKPWAAVEWAVTLQLAMLK